MRALWAKRPRSGLIHHSDRGVQYCAQDYQDQLRQFGLIPSMSRNGNCYDNAPMESFWGTLKNELVHHRRYDTREQARREITEYIETLLYPSASTFTAGKSLARGICPAVGPQQPAA